MNRPCDDRRVRKFCGVARGLVLLAGLSALVSARAEDVTPTVPNAVTAIALPDAIQLALAHNPDFRSAGYDVMAAQGAVVQASVLPNPSLFLYSYSTPLSRTEHSAAPVPVPTQLGISWTIPVGGKISAATQAAREELAATKSTQEATRRQTISNVQTAFVTVLLDQALVDFARQDQAGFHKELELNELRYKVGKIAYGDLLKLRIQAVTIDDTVRQAAEALQAARADLQHVIGENVLAPDFKVLGNLAAPNYTAPTDVEALLDVALKNRPDYVALLAQERSAQSSLLLAQRTPIPDIGIAVDYNWANANTGVDGRGNYDIGLSVPIPLFDRNKGNIMAGQAALVKARLAEESMRTQIRSDLVKALEEWKASSTLLAAYEHGTVSDARESLEITRHAYELGTQTILDFLDAESSYRQIESAYRAALGRTMLAVFNIRFITGEVQ